MGAQICALKLLYSNSSQEIWVEPKGHIFQGKGPPRASSGVRLIDRPLSRVHDGHVHDSGHTAARRGDRRSRSRPALTPGMTAARMSDRGPQGRVAQS